MQHEMMVLIIIIISSHATSAYSVPHAVPFTVSHKIFQHVMRPRLSWPSLYR